MAMLFSLLATAQTPEPSPPGASPGAERPHLDPFPVEQDWGFLADPETNTTFLDRFKYVSWGEGAQQYLSFGLEFRSEYEYFDDWMFGAGVQDHNGYVLMRLMPHLDLHVGPSFRFFTELTFNDVFGRNGGPRPNVDEDRGDVHQAFMEFGQRLSMHAGTSVRIGRQEIVFGSGRLFDNNEGPNVKLAFDGARVITQSGALRWDNFIAKPVQNNTGFFDDTPNHAQTTWGSYLTFPVKELQQSTLDVYYLGLALASAQYNRGSAGEMRHTLGMRLSRSVGRGLDYNWEANDQLGSFGKDRVQAWSVSTETGYTFAQSPLRPRPLLRFDVYSGDGGASSHPLGTYNAYFPRGAYFTPKVVPFLGNQNLIDVHPQVQFAIRPNITGEIGASWDWRESPHDGVYAFGGGQLLVSSNNNPKRYLGYQGDAELRWSPRAHVVLAANLAGFHTSGFLLSAANHDCPIAANLGLTYRF